MRTLLCTMRAGRDAHLTRHRLHRFLARCVDSQISDLLILAATVDQRWPEINAFIATGITNARTKGYNRLLKRGSRVGCGFRNRENAARRIRFHSTSKQRPQRRLNADCPVKIERRRLHDQKSRTQGPPPISWARERPTLRDEGVDIGNVTY
ncbi:hypothetical protein MSIMFB_01762 [Mycobacterium simulans]|uniref:Transposase IS204/IS1001/IS1096/IS1165 DDE domain-containing protein n=1 Tax=Mycobacterium simulans TaxID=627089 RepID=A0A7Z7IIN2_9MYCO|nr:transposase [Mycobacterium simulans]SOJ54263.1 hypothetical protein MSIMFB_01762 [Mycobacterium simulans]